MEPAAHVTTCRLESERLVLEPLRREHADELARVLGDRSLYRFIGGEPASAEELRARLERQIRGRSPDGSELWLNWTVRSRPAGVAVGTLQATVGARGREAELAWVIGTAHQGHGFAQQGAALVATWLQDHGVRRLRAHIHPGHDASIAVARSIGLVATDVVADGEVLWQTSATS